jgi:hypothetical protein
MEPSFIKYYVLRQFQEVPKNLENERDRLEDSKRSKL